MKFALCLSLLLTGSVWSKTMVKFNQVLNDDVHKEIKNDDDKFKQEARRGPASVQPEVRPLPKAPPSKLDKNVRQIGPDRW
jgi:hypothetical protein